ncbi:MULTISPECIES: hypothetical protein [unclassified Streptomyces]|uniref:hypothetical protein n=1 Tax=unclassified Streptomyces TaxID=2593676 RepID=UPI0036E0FBC2
MDAPMKFVQIIEYETDRADEMREMGEQAEQRFGSRSGGPTHRLVLRDRDHPNRYLAVIEFDSYEEAMSNSNDPETGKFAQEMAALCTKQPTFTNCDVVDSADLR